MTNTWNNDNSKIRKVLNTRNNDKVFNFQLSLILKIVEDEEKNGVFLLKNKIIEFKFWSSIQNGHRPLNLPAAIFPNILSG